MEVDEERQLRAAWTARQALAVYLMAGASYITLGILVPELLFSWWEGVPFLLLFIWVAHTLQKRYG